MDTEYKIEVLTSKIKGKSREKSIQYIIPYRLQHLKLTEEEFEILKQVKFKHCELTLCKVIEQTYKNLTYDSQVIKWKLK